MSSVSWEGEHLTEMWKLEVKQNVGLAKLDWMLVELEYDE
jgi:hypothetical protein